MRVVRPSSIDPFSALGKIIAAGARSLRDDHNNARAAINLLSMPTSVCSRDLTYRWVSQEVARTLGRPVEEIIGRAIVDIIGHEAFGLIQPNIDRVLRGECIEDDERFLGADHEWRWVHVLYAPTFGKDDRPDGWVLMPFDPAEQQRATQRLMDSELRFRNLVDTLPAITWLIDENSGSVFVNKAYEDFTGSSANQIIKDWQSFFHPEDREKNVRAVGTALKRHLGWQAEFRMRRHDGVYRWFEVTAVPRFEGDRFVGYTGCSFDITDRKAAQDALIEANRQKEEFIAVLGHELRNPLSVISNVVGVLDQIGNKDQATVRAREIIRRQLGNLSRLMDDLLDRGRLAAGKIELIRQPTNLADIVTRSIQALQHALSTQSHALELRTEPTWVHGDPVRLEQIVTNLLDNAIKFTPKQGRITVSVRADTNRAMFTVADSGMGIPQEFLPRLFQPFAQVKPAFSGQPSGLGLGLALVKRLVEMHDGEISAVSEGPGFGSTFVVSLPLIDQPVHETTTLLSDGAPSRRRVLIVEDNDDNREVIHELLMMEGHEVMSASDGPQAIECAVKLSPEVALVDLALPTWDGYEVARRLRDQFGTTIRLVALTGFGRERDRAAARTAGFDEFLVKPVDPDRLLALLQTDEALVQTH